MSKQSIKEAVKSLKEYINSYDGQQFYESYAEETLIKDILYGLGIALDPEKYKYSDGFDRFKEVLRKHLD